MMGKKGSGYILFTENKILKINLSNDKSSFILKWINPLTGEILGPDRKIAGGKISTLETPVEGAVVGWLVKGN